MCIFVARSPMAMKKNDNICLISVIIFFNGLIFAELSLWDF